MFADTGYEDDRWWWQLCACLLLFSPAWAIALFTAGVAFWVERDNMWAGLAFCLPTTVLFVVCAFGTYCTGSSSPNGRLSTRQAMYKQALGGDGDEG